MDELKSCKCGGDVKVLIGYSLVFIECQWCKAVFETPFEAGWVEKWNEAQADYRLLKGNAEEDHHDMVYLLEQARAEYDALTAEVAALRARVAELEQALAHADTMQGKDVSDYIALQAENKALKEAAAWVSVGERLPEVMSNKYGVSSFSDDVFLTDGDVCFVGRYFAGYKNPYWVADCEEYKGVTPTHWRPLPTPPEAE